VPARPQRWLPSGTGTLLALLIAVTVVLLSTTAVTWLLR
jgi:hypothetical protein